MHADNTEMQSLQDETPFESDIEAKITNPAENGESGTGSGSRGVREGQNWLPIRSGINRENESWF